MVLSSDTSFRRFDSRHAILLGALLTTLLPSVDGKVTPCAVATWKFGEIAVREAARWLEEGHSAVDAAERAVNAVELDTQDQYFVGVGGLPNRDGDMELDAAIMRGRGYQLGCVLAVQGISTPVSVARRLMEHGQHTVLAGKTLRKRDQLVDVIILGTRRRSENVCARERVQGRKYPDRREVRQRL